MPPKEPRPEPRQPAIRGRQPLPSRRPLAQAPTRIRPLTSQPRLYEPLPEYLSHSDVLPSLGPSLSSERNACWRVRINEDYRSRRVKNLTHREWMTVEANNFNAKLMPAFTKGLHVPQVFFVSELTISLSVLLRTCLLNLGNLSVPDSRLAESPGGSQIAKSGTQLDSQITRLLIDPARTLGLTRWNSVTIARSSGNIVAVITFERATKIKSGGSGRAFRQEAC